MRGIISLLSIALLSGCIGTDFTNDPIGEDLSEAIIEPSSLVLKPGEEATLDFEYRNMLGEPETAEWNFFSESPGIATVTNAGLVTAVSSGQTKIVGTAFGEVSDSVLVTVVLDSQSVAQIDIVSTDTVVAVDEQVQLTSEVRNAAGDLLTGLEMTWMSDDTSVAFVDNNGLVTGKNAGTCNITVAVGDISSLPFPIRVDGGDRSGTFVGLNGYSVSGTAILTTRNGEAFLSFADNFRSQSGPGLVVILSPNANSVSGGINLGALKAQSGVQDYLLPSGTDPAAFQAVFVYCEPFGLPFGSAQFP